MKPAWDSPAGHRALAHVLAGRPLLAFDFDGTLAPFVARPVDATTPPGWDARLRVIAARWPVAVLSGREVGDLRARLGFSPRIVVGNHGAQTDDQPAHGPLAALLDPCRAWLDAHRHAWEPLSVRLEDKGSSLALHHRQATDSLAAMKIARDLAAWANGSSARVSHGHAVTNIVPAGAPHKGDALLAALATCGCDRALFVGDDVNDEPAFESAPPDSMTIRIGPDDQPTAPGFSMRAQSEVGAMLRLLLNRT